jgi:NAD(P)-dependent dehydrogenase (short-subunit alcohol dehydrogenase family)
VTAVAVVTGAASGMGRLAAQRLAASGVSVAAVDVNDEGLVSTARRSPNMRTYTCDVTDPAAVTATVEAIERDLGPADQLVHAAGRCRIGRTLEQPLDEFFDVVKVNLMGTVHVTRSIVPTMKRAGHGTVVIFGSLAGWLPSPKLAAYSASKFAVTAYAEILAEELDKTGVQVMCVCPPEVATPLARGVREVDASVLGGTRPMSAARVLDCIELALARKNPPLFLFPGMASSVSRARRFAPNVLRTQLMRHVPVS